MFQIIDELSIRVIGSIGAAESCIEDGRWATVTAGKRVAARRSQIGLSVLEILQESVFEDIHFVRIDGDPLVEGVVTVVSDFQRHRTTKPALNADIPGLGCGFPEIGLDAVDTRSTRVGELCFGRRRLVRRGRQNESRQGVSDREAPGSERSRLACVVREQVELLVVELPVVRGVIPEILVWLGKAAQRIAAADHCLILAQQAFQGAGGDVRIPCKAKRRLWRDLPWRVRLRMNRDRRIQIALQ